MTAVHLHPVYALVLFLSGIVVGGFVVSAVLGFLGWRPQQG